MAEYTPQQGKIFLPPYGERDQHVIGASLNRGYRLIVAHMVAGGYAASYITKMCQQAAEDGAPPSALTKYQGQWLTTEQCEGVPDLGSWLEYANVLAWHEQYTMPCDVWATTNDTNWLDRNGTPDVRMVHNVPRHEADEIARRIELVSVPGTVVNVRPV